MPKGPFKTGVYKILNKTNGKFYIGSASVSFDRRWREHRSRLRTGIHQNRYLLAAWNKYGEASFEFLIIERCAPSLCLDREQYWLNLTQCFKKEIGYNLSGDATGSLGVKWSEEAKKRHSARLMGRVITPESIAKRTLKQKGMKRSEQTKQRMSEVAKTSVRAVEARKRMVGVARNPETVKKISEAAHRRIQAKRKAEWDESVRSVIEGGGHAGLVD